MSTQRSLKQHESARRAAKMAGNRLKDRVMDVREIEPCWMCKGVERHTRECTPPLGLRTGCASEHDDSF